MVWAILSTFTNYILGMLLAVAINSKLVKLKQVWRTCFIVAIAIPQFVSLLLISRALEPAGAINILLLGWVLSIRRSPSSQTQHMPESLWWWSTSGSAFPIP